MVVGCQTHFQIFYLRLRPLLKKICYLKGGQSDVTPNGREASAASFGVIFLKLGDFGLVAGLTASQQFYLALEQNP